MTGLEAVLAAVIVGWFVALLGLTVRLVRARPEDQQRVQRMLTAVVTAGVIIVIGPSIIQWLTGYRAFDTSSGKRWCSENPNTSNKPVDDICLPADVTEVLTKLINGLRAIGGVVLIVGIIWGAIELRARQ